jgi:hypothetical protein
MGGFEMTRKLNPVVSLLFLILMLGLLILPAACWGGATFKLVVENQSQYVLTIYVNDYKMGNVNPGKQIEDSFSVDTGKFKIEAKNLRVETVFSKIFTFDQMERIDNKKIWKVVIPSLQN